MVALIDDAEWLCSFDSEGRHSVGQPSGADLINVPVRHKRWAVIYDAPVCKGGGTLVELFAHKPAPMPPHVIALIPIEFEEGEGLE